MSHLFCDNTFVFPSLVCCKWRLNHCNLGLFPSEVNSLITFNLMWDRRVHKAVTMEQLAHDKFLRFFQHGVICLFLHKLRLLELA